MSRELEVTRRYEVSDFPPGTRMLVGDRRDLDAAIVAGQVRAVGRFNQLSGGATSVPVVYVSQRAKPFHERHRKGLIIGGAVGSSLAALTALIVWVGPLEFLAGIILAALTIILLNRMASGGGRHRSVTVTTTTKVRVR